MQRLESGESTVIAPHEVRELLERLTQADTEGVDPNESRTLAGLSADTGIPIAQLRNALEDLRRGARRRLAGAGTAVAAIAVAGVAYYGLVFRTPPTPAHLIPSVPAAAPATTDVDESGLIDIGGVTWNSNLSGSAQADPSFVPTTDLPNGLSMTANIGQIYWGTGDLHAEVFSRVPTPQEQEQFRRTVEDLLRHVRERAQARRLPLSKQPSLGPYRTSLPHYTVSPMMQSYGGAATFPIDLPANSDSRADAEADRIIKAAARDLVKRFTAQLKQSLRFQGLD